MEVSRLVPCCACENWVHLECSYGIPEGRLCAAHCQIIDPLKGVVVTDFNCPKGDRRCLVPWRPWAKKNKVQWEAKRGTGQWGWDREFFEMIPNWALEKHAWLGAGLIWKRVHASSTTDRLKEDDPSRLDKDRPRVVKTQEEKKAAGPLPPWKALPLITPWDDSYTKTYHTDFEPSKADADLSWRCSMTSLAWANYSNLEVMHGYVSPDRPWLLSPPQIPIEGATRRDPEDVRVMVYHGLTYSHSGLTDPAVMPGYVAVAKWRHDNTLAWTGLNPALPEWSMVAGWFENRNWDLGKDMQAFARPDGAERTMVYSADARGWVPRQREPQPVPKKTAKSAAKPKEEKKEDSPKKRRRRPATTEPDEKDENREVVNVKPKDSELDAEENDDQGEKAPHPPAEGDEPRVAEKQEKTKEMAQVVVLKKADDPAVKEKADALLGEKAPHSPVDRSVSEEVHGEKVVDDPYAKAPHGDSTDEDVLEAELRSLGGLPRHRRSDEGRSDRSDRAAYDDEERRSVPSSSLAIKEKKKKRKTEKAMDSRSVLSEEPTKRKKKSKHGSKKAAKKGHRQSSQLPPVDTYELDLEGVPRDKLEQTVGALHRVNQGLKSSSDRAESALSGNVPHDRKDDSSPE